MYTLVTRERGVAEWKLARDAELMRVARKSIKELDQRA